ncbi:MAG: hypothetical protein OIF57_18275 [Marinobacterium sp.]|nr:hypothetical protein [Marinobacterium sp.]
MEDARQDMAIRLLRLSEQPERQNQTVTAAYIVQTFKHVLTDRMRALKGRPRPRKWLRELYGNELAVQLLDLVCLQQLGHGEILEALRDRLNAAQVTEVLSAMSRMRECDRWQTSETSQNAEGYVESPDDDN